MQEEQGKHFSITDPKGISTIIYKLNETEKEFLKDHPKYTVERLEYTDELRGDTTKRTFFIENIKDHGDKIVILSFGRDKVVINSGVLDEDRVRISKKPVPFKFETLHSSETSTYKEFFYTPNLKRPISIIDPETTEEVKPRLYFDEETNEVKGKCKLKPNKPYFVFEIRDENGDINLKGGTPKFIN